MNEIHPKFEDKFDTVVKCPYCGHIQDNEVTYGLEDGEDIECENCGKRFWVNVYIEYLATPDCELNHEKHEWVLYDKEHNIYMCRKCGQTKVEYDG